MRERALGIKMWTASNASLATLDTTINAFLAGQGTPTLRDTAQVVGTEIRHDGTVFFAWILYTE